MALSLDSLVKKKATKPPRCLIYGVPGVGKTSLAAEFPSPIFIQTEEGEGNLELTTFTKEPFTQLSQVEEAIELLLGDGEPSHGFRTVVLDSVDHLEPLIWAEACRQNGWKKIEDPGFGKGYLAAGEVWRHILAGLNALRDVGMNVVLLGHEQVKTFNDPERDSYERYIPKLHKIASDLVVESCDVVAFMGFVVATRSEKVGFGKETKKGTGAGKRAIWTEERPARTAKNRFGMPERIMIEPGKGYTAIAPYLPGQPETTDQEAA